MPHIPINPKQQIKPTYTQENKGGRQKCKQMQHTQSMDFLIRRRKLRKAEREREFSKKDLEF